MAPPPGQAAPAYEPVSVDGDIHQDVLYNPPRSHNAMFSPSDSPVDISLVDFDSNDPQIGDLRPRFIGAALAQEGFRQSYASSQGSVNANSFKGGLDDTSSSLYALNPAGGRDSSIPRGYASVPFHEDLPFADFHGSDATLGGGIGKFASPASQPLYLEEKREAYVPQTRSKRKVIIASILIGVVAIIVAVVVAVYFTVIKKNSNSGSNGNAASPSASASGKPTSPNNNLVISGGDGSTVTMNDGTTFTYSNKLGGTWYYDPADPFNGAAQPNTWTPPLNQSFQYGVNRIFGVNLGGWLVPEPFIAPALFEKYINSNPVPVDEWTLSQAMAADTAGGGLNQLETHYKTFITEMDFAEIAGAGLNYVRIPLAYWAIETRAGEPFLAKISWQYFLLAIEWARKYGIRINLDLHAVPGSQNGWNHSGKLGTINFLYGPMGYANAQRTLDYIRVITEFISQPQYSQVVTMFGVLNEPRGSPILGQENMANFYGQVYNEIRAITGLGDGKGPFISYHDAFFGTVNWAGFLANGDRMALDLHPYICFGPQSAAPISSFATTPCNIWGAMFNQSMKSFGLTGAGEWSNAVTDCGLWLNGVNLGARYDGTFQDGNTWPVQGSCTPITDYQNWSQATKTATMQFALASMDSLQNWFFWTWKIGNSSVSGKVESPAWSYKLGLEQGWMPLNPMDSLGTCGNTSPWTGPLKSWQVGGAGAGVGVSFGAATWPPTSLAYGGSVATLPSYTPTGTIPTLPVPSFSATGKSISAGNGWFNAADKGLMDVPISTCNYLNPWVGSAVAPVPLCSGVATKREIPLPIITPPPS